MKLLDVRSVPKLVSGTAEIFGTEIVTEQTYTFVGTKAAIFTYHGATISVRGSAAVSYVAEDTPMMSYANLHFTLEKLRQQSEDSQSQGPRILLLGSEDAGKTSLTKILTGYAVRQGRKPIVIGLDPKQVTPPSTRLLTRIIQSMLSVPGTLTAACISTTLDVEEGFGSSTIQGYAQIPTKVPLVYYYGHQSPMENLTLYKKLVSRLALAVTSRLDEDSDGALYLIMLISQKGLPAVSLTPLASSISQSGQRPSAILLLNLQ
jgi:polyribonucleotide 5'-hydroxyl-kinase